jgi:hypothetical protein
MGKRNMVGLLRVFLLGLGVYLVISILNPDMATSAWSTNPTTICNAAANQSGPRLIKGNDGYIVLWQDERRVNRDIYAQKFDVDGNMKWADNGRVIAAGNNGEASNHLLYNSQSLTEIVSDTQGGAIVLWTEDYSCSSGPCGNAWITRVHSDSSVRWGMPPSPAVTIQGTDTAVLLNSHAHADALAPDGEGGAFVIFGVNAWGSWYVLRLDANGACRSATADVVGARSGARMIYGGNSNGKDYVSIAWWDYGDFAINIEDPEVNYPASTDTLYAPWNKITLTSTPAWWSEPSVISDGAGGAIVVWEDGRNGNSDIFAQKISADGKVQWPPTGVPIAVQPGRQRRQQVVSDGAGGAVVVWEDSRTSPTRVYAQHVGADGNTRWAANGIPISSTYGESPKIIKSDLGAYIIEWVDTDHNGGTPDYLRAQKINEGGSLLWPLDSRTPSGPTGVVISEIYSDDFDIASDGSSGLIAVWSLRGDIYANRVGNVFPDIPFGYWAENYISAIYNTGVTTGCAQDIPDTPEDERRYCSEDPVTREQMAVFITRALDQVPEDGYCGSTAPFTDVSPDRWSCKYVKRLVELGITVGIGQGFFGPEDTVTREQMAVFLTRALDEVPSDGYCGTEDPFTDVPYSWWSCKYVKRLMELEITAGIGEGLYGPGDPVTRAQMAVFLSRAFLGM